MPRRGGTRLRIALPLTAGTGRLALTSPPLPHNCSLEPEPLRVGGLRWTMPGLESAGRSLPLQWRRARRIWIGSTGSPQSRPKPAASQPSGHFVPAGTRTAAENCSSGCSPDMNRVATTVSIGAAPPARRSTWRRVPMHSTTQPLGPPERSSHDHREERYTRLRRLRPYRHDRLHALRPSPLQVQMAARLRIPQPREDDQQGLALTVSVGADYVQRPCRLGPELWWFPQGCE